MTALDGPATTEPEAEALVDTVSSSPPVRVWHVAVLSLVVFLVGLYGSPYVLTVASQAGIIAVVVFGLTVLTGYTGQISFGQTVFFGAGAYATAKVTSEYDVTPVVGLVAAIAVAVAAALLVGWPVLRLRGHFLTLATFALALIFYSWSAASPITNGLIGIGGIETFSVLGVAAEAPFARFWVVGTVLVVAFVAVSRLRSGRFGRALVSLSNDEATAQSVGIATGRYRLAAFLISAVFAALGGWLYAHAIQYVSPETFGFNAILMFFMVLFLGGSSSPIGALVAAVVVVALPELFPEGLQEWQPTIFAAVLILVLIVAPGGLSPRRTNRSRAGRRAVA